jgi:hypothetical protein
VGGASAGLDQTLWRGLWIIYGFLDDRCTRSTFGKEHGQLVLTTARDTCARELIVSIKQGIVDYLWVFGSPTL